MSWEEGLELSEGQEERVLTGDLHLDPQPGETSETGLVFLGSLSPPLLFSSSVFVRKGVVLIKVLGFPQVLK